MVKRRRSEGKESDGEHETTPHQRTVFVDTTLDTHLILLLSISDTVSDFKRKIALEHLHCFPDIGDIRVNSLKIKRRLNFYRLPETMILWTAFQGLKGNWFLSADVAAVASSSGTTPVCRPNQVNPTEQLVGTSNDVKMDLVNYNGTSSDTPIAMCSPNGVLPFGLTDDDKSSEKKTTGSETEPRAKKRRKTTHSHREDVHVSSQDISEPKTSVVDAVEEGRVQSEHQNKPTISERSVKVSGAENDVCSNGDGVAFEGTSVPAAEEEKGSSEINVNFEKHDERKEESMLESIIPDNVMAGDLESNLRGSAPTDHQGVTAGKIPNISAMLMEASGAMADVNSDAKKSKKKKSKVTRGKIQDTADIEQTIKGENIKLGSETHISEEHEGGKEVHLDHDHELIKTSFGKPSDEAGPDLTIKEAIFSQNTTEANVVWKLGENAPTDHQKGVAVEVPNISTMLMDAGDAMANVNTDGKKRKKKKSKETRGTDIGQTREGENIKLSTEAHKPEELGGGKDMHLNHDHELNKESNGKPSHEAGPGVTINEANVVMEPEIASGTTKKKKKKVKKNDETDIQKLNLEQTDNGVSGALDETEKRGNILNHKQEDVQMKLLDSSAADATQEVPNANENVVYRTTKKKKRKVKEYTGTDIEKLIMEQTNNGVSGSLDETEKREIIPNHNREDVQMKLLHGSDADAAEEVRNANGNVADETTEKRKRKVKKYTGSDIEKLNTEQTDNSVSGAFDETKKRESIPNSNRDVMQMNLVDGSSPDATEEVRNVNGNMADGNAGKKKRKVKKYTGTDIEKLNIKKTDNGVNGALNETEKRESIPDHNQEDMQVKLLDSSAAVAGEEVCNVNGNVGDGTTKKKNRKVKKNAETDVEKLSMKRTDTGVTGVLDEAEKRESIPNHNREVVQMKLVDVSVPDASKEVHNANENFVTCSQTEQTVKDVSIGEEKKEKKAKSTADSQQVDFPALIKENSIVQYNQEVNSGEDPEKKDKKSKRKSKKNILTASDVQEKLPITVQKVGLEALTTEKNLISLVTSKPEHKGEQKLEDMNVATLNSDNLAVSSEIKGDGINFKHYFLATPDQEKVDSGEKIKNATTSTAETKSRKKVKGNGSTSVSVSTELQSSLKSSENLGTESKSRVRKTTSGEQNGYSVQYSDQGGADPKSIKRSSTVSGEGVNDSSPVATLQKHNVKVKNGTLEKSSSEKSQLVPKILGNKSLPFGLNLTNKMVMKTPSKRSLFSNSGSIFQDNSGESSSDETGIVHSDASTRTPSDFSSDSSSMSSDSEEQSDLSQDSTERGSSDSKGRSTGGKTVTKLDFSAIKDATMDSILKSSKRFKKAKLLVNELEYKNTEESQEVEVVPDSLPNP